MAAHVCLSPDHFQRTFTAWAGVSPKQFARTLTVEHAKRLLAGPGAPPSLFAAAEALGLSSSSRLHDAFLRVEAMSPGTFRTGGAGLLVQYAFAKTRLGEALVASTPHGICTLTFTDDRAAALADLARRLPGATLREADATAEQRRALDLVDGAAANSTHPLALHLRGTPFQVQVWCALLRIPAGEGRSYGNLAEAIGRPGASRAVGTAIGANPVAYLIPCHRVLRASGALGGYAWGAVRKAALLGIESSDQSSPPELHTG